MKTWLITGCSSGIGRGIAKAVLANGDRAVITSRNTEKLVDLARQYPDTALAVSLEVTDPASIANAVEAAKARFGAIDILVNNAGRGYSGAIEEGDPAAVQELFNTNFFGPVALIKAVLPCMRARRSGAVINISSLGALTCGMGGGYYAASKGALEKMSEALRKEAAPLGIKVMVVEPGPFRTQFRVGGIEGCGNTIPDYAPAHEARSALKNDPYGQKGDPDKAGEIIAELIGREDYPKMLLLGGGVSDTGMRILQEEISEIAKWKGIGDTADYE